MLDSGHRCLHRLNCYRTPRNVSYVSGLDEIFENVGQSTIFEMIDEVLSLGLSDNENNYVVIRLFTCFITLPSKTQTKLIYVCMFGSNKVLLQEIASLGDTYYEPYDLSTIL